MSRRTQHDDALPSIFHDLAWAHVIEQDGWRSHGLAAHLHDVAAMAGRFGDVFGAGRLAEIAGRWHDLGKYSDDFPRTPRIL